MPTIFNRGLGLAAGIALAVGLAARNFETAEAGSATDALERLEHERFDALLQEHLTYVAQAEGTAMYVDILAWWKAREPVLPAWFKAFVIVGLIQPSSAARIRLLFLLSFARAMQLRPVNKLFRQWRT